MEQTVFKIGEVSARLGLVDKNSNTLRGWAEEFGEFLSALANPAPGQPRRFTVHDLQVLTAIRDYRALHLTYDEIRERLRAGEHTVSSPLQDTMDDEAVAAGAQALVPAAQMERLLAPLVASVEEWRRLAEEYRGRLESRELRIEELERRIDGLYARLTISPVPDSTPAAPVPSPNGAEPRGEEPPAETVPVAGPSVNGTVAPADAGPSIFPLPAVERSRAEAMVDTGDADARRRRWWQFWR
jgi:DNA-binding transcriptional MerR regulator